MILLQIKKKTNTKYRFIKYKNGGSRVSGMSLNFNSVPDNFYDVKVAGNVCACVYNTIIV